MPALRTKTGKRSEGLRIVFMGTPDFAVPVFKALVGGGHEVTLAVTQPDRERGRGKAVSRCPVAAAADEAGIPVFQPVKLRAEECVQRIREEAPDAIVVAAYGQILPQPILSIPAYGCINVHASLLPRLRGAAPIQWAVMGGEEYSGVSIMQMDAGLDTGDVILQEKVKLDPKETALTLYEKLADLGGSLLIEALKKIEAGTAVRVPQDDALSTYAPMLKKDMALIDFTRPAEEIERGIRGRYPWPGSMARLNGKQLKIFSADVLPQPDETAGSAAEPERQGGTILRADKSGILVKTGEGCLLITELQPEGKRRMAARDYLLGYPVQAGERFE